MRLAFINMGDGGYAEYDPETDSYSWSYEGDESEIIDLLSELESSKVYDIMDSAREDSGSEEISYYFPEEEYIEGDWNHQIISLANSLKENRVEILYVGE